MTTHCLPGVAPVLPPYRLLPSPMLPLCRRGQVAAKKPLPRRCILLLLLLLLLLLCLLWL
jgi:hypothetical protein